MRAIMLAILGLGAYSAIGEDADTAFCDTIDGAIAEFRNLDYGGGTEHDFDESEYSVSRITQPAKLPGAASCGAYVYGAYRSSRIYTCQWTGNNPRSTFVVFGGQLHSCLAKRGYSASSPVDGEGPLIAGLRTEDRGDRFTRLWETEGGLDQFYLVAYKMSTKGVFLQMRFLDDSYGDRKRRIRNWLREHKRAKRNLERCRRQWKQNRMDCTVEDSMGTYIYGDDNPYKETAGESYPALEAVGELWEKSGRNAGELP